MLRLKHTLSGLQLKPRSPGDNNSMIEEKETILGDCKDLDLMSRQRRALI